MIAAQGYKCPYLRFVGLPVAAFGFVGLIIFVLAGWTVGLWIATAELVMLSYAYGMQRRAYSRYLEDLCSARHSTERYALVLRSFEFRSLHEQQQTVVPIAGPIIPQVTSLANPAGRACRSLGLRPVIIGGDLIGCDAESRFVYLNYDYDDWWDAFSILSQYASVIILVPETSPSLLAELKSIRERDLLDRTVFLGPPDQTDKLPVVNNEPDCIATRWEEVRAELGEHGVELPEFEPSGIVFSFHVRDGRLLPQTLTRGDRQTGPISGEEEFESMLTRSLSTLMKSGGGALHEAMQHPAVAGTGSVPFSPLLVPGTNFQFIIQLVLALGMGIFMVFVLIFAIINLFIQIT